MLFEFIFFCAQQESDFESGATPKGNINLSDMTASSRAAVVSEADPATAKKLTLVVANRTFELEAESVELADQWKAHFSVFFEM